MGEINYEFLEKRAKQLPYECNTALLRESLTGAINLTDYQIEVLVKEIDTRFCEGRDVKPSN